MLASTSMRCRPSSVGSSASTAGARAPAPVPRLCARHSAPPMAAVRAPSPALRLVGIAAAASKKDDDAKAAALSPLRRARLVGVAAAASKRDGDDDKAALSPETKKRFDAMLAQLRSTGLNQEKARRLLKAWAKAGALEPEALKQLLVRRALNPATALGTQAAIDGVCAAVGFFAGASVGGAEDLPFKILLQVACYFGAMWYAISAGAGASALAQVLLAARRYASSADALLAAVQTLAGPEGGVGVGAPAANVALAVSTAKVVAALDSIAEQLRAMDGGAAAEGGGPAAAQKSTLISLAAFLTVQQAEEKAGFVPADYGLTEKEATDIAAVFAMYDRNENFVLDVEELGQMCRELGRDLTDAEVREAGRLLAAGGGAGGAGGGAADGDPRGVTFPAFVRWWTGRGPAAAGDKKEAAPAA